MCGSMLCIRHQLQLNSVNQCGCASCFDMARCCASMHQYGLMLCIRHQYGSMPYIKHHYCTIRCCASGITIRLIPACVSCINGNKASASVTQAVLHTSIWLNTVDSSTHHTKTYHIILYPLPYLLLCLWLTIIDEERKDDENCVCLVASLLPWRCFWAKWMFLLAIRI